MAMHHKNLAIAGHASDTILKRGVANEPRFNRANGGSPACHRSAFVLTATSALFGLYFLFSCSGIWLGSNPSVTNQAPSNIGAELVKYALTATTPLLEVFQVSPPVLTVQHGTLELTDGSSNDTITLVGEQQSSSCQVTLAVHSFAYSYGDPFVGNYTPPNCDFNRVTWNLSVTSAGRQFDRLGIVYLGDVEVFRTSTAEPTTTGIHWVYLKDMTPYSALLRQQQKLIFDLGNIVDSTYTAAFNVTLVATFFTAPDSISPADIILPISARQSDDDAASVFTLPPDTAANNLTFPRNTLRAVFTVAATGQSDEEFWWSNVPSLVIDTFPQTGSLYGYSPFREVQLYIDGLLAGVAWPFPVIFTGGVVPGLWRPIVGIEAFDLLEDEIDITPWLPLLCDGSSHEFLIRVSGLSESSNGTAVLSGTTESYWLVTGKVFIWLDESNHTTTGTPPTRNLPSPSLHISSSVGEGYNGTNETLTYQVTAQRQLSISSTVRTSQGETRATWQQSLSFANFGNLTDAGNVQVNEQITTATEHSSSGYAKRFNYPLWAYTAYSTFLDNYTIEATVNRGKDVETVGQPVFPTGLESFSSVQDLQSQVSAFQGASLFTTQNGSATYIANETSSTSFSFGTTEQDMVFAGLETDSSTAAGFPSISGSTELFHRYVMAVNYTVVEDEENLVDTGIIHNHLDILDSSQDFAAPGVKSMLGRGPEGAGQA
ncbi:peptide N-acetyl-beta-D-glucosaminyl asparaginase amidase A-domain-containing protein [Delphinella strobiligena]|nr:peptide N-acetyl-beta-D-glucosaminyl asparaginase amidase A-domain-containing protein [Delphinella strobiligena]